MPYPYTAEQIERFWLCIDRNGPVINPSLGACWIYNGPYRGNGYGNFTVDPGEYIGAHVFACELIFGPVKKPFEVLHGCDIKRCVRHVYPGTHAQNQREMVERGRAATGDRNGARIHRDRMRRGNQHGLRLHPERIARGAHQGSAKLNDTLVLEIRARWQVGHVFMHELATDYAVSTTTIRKIVRRLTWTHI